MTRMILLNKDKDDKTEIKTTLRLQKGILKELKKIAIDHNMSFAELMTKLAKECINRESGKK